MLDDESEGWLLSDEDNLCIEELVGVIKSLSKMAKSGSCLVGVGEIWDALECILNDGDEYEIEISVNLTVGSEVGDADSNEGRFACLDMSYEEDIRLSVLHTSYTREVGSDHNTVAIAHLAPVGNFDRNSIKNWIEEAKRARAGNNAKLAVYRNHV